MALGAFLGLDWLLCEFYLALLVMIFFKICQVALDEIYTRDQVDAGLVKLIPKWTKKDIVSGWRPITLLKCVLQIVSLSSHY